MEFIRPDTNIDFVGKRRYALLGSLILILAGIVSLVLHGGPRYGIDFAGGTLVQVKFNRPVEFKELREVLREVGFGDAILQPFGGRGEFLIRMKKTTGELRGVSAKIEEAFKRRFGEESFEIRRVEMVGPKVGRDLRVKGLKAIIFALIGILIYISWRFEFRFAVGAVAALVHDVLVTVGMFSLTDKEISLPVVAALLTIVGYSLNDTIVVYDRIRENMRRVRGQLEEIINRSINETLSRTILTSLTTLIVVVVLFALGGGIIRDFAFALIVGVVVGTYSSVYIASPLVISLERTKRGRGKRG
ncbi:MAG: protein translocase subunit SecF [Deltaproteobacteria bacterium]|nr:MAG: protein translocase subunit SecF [Deltaproteobacteria bacterium]